MPVEEKPLYPFKLCQQGARLHGQVVWADLPDVASVLLSDHGAVTYELVCDHDEEEVPRVCLHVSAELPLLCQRCLQPLVWPVDCVTLLSPVRTQAAQQQLSVSYEPLQVSETGAVRLTDLLTEELWLALPQLPKHDTACVVQTDYPATMGIASEKPGPFAALCKLRLQP